MLKISSFLLQKSDCLQWVPGVLLQSPENQYNLNIIKQLIISDLHRNWQPRHRYACHPLALPISVPQGPKFPDIPLKRNAFIILWIGHLRKVKSPNNWD